MVHFLLSQTPTLNPPPLDSTPTSPKEIISLFTSLQTQLFDSLMITPIIIHLNKMEGNSMILEMTSIEQMRASQLYNLFDLDLGLPKVESNEKTIEILVEAPRLATENSKLGNLAAVQGLFPPHLNIPSGWRPGMPVELPTDFPIIPPVDGNQGSVEEQQPRRAPPMPVKGPESFQVRHVQLDIDQDDSSSEYGSEGSSEED
ncbi:hypothetical protein MKW92_010175 [Papaver armeniacum]|nr:hypothetical protein MKW92_010175 [Papaver armeniacum]